MAILSVIDKANFGKKCFEIILQFANTNSHATKEIIISVLNQYSLAYVCKEKYYSIKFQVLQGFN